MSNESNDGPVLRKHVYDGIQEYDQKLPNWWLFTLHITIVFFIGYWFAYFQFKIFKNDAERLDPIVEEIQQKRMGEMLAMLDNENLWKMSRDAAVVNEGQKVYMATCFPCHGPNLGGKIEAPIYIGLSLLDDEWKYGGSPKAIYQMVYDGTPNPVEVMAKGEIVMPPQGAVLGPEKIAKVAAFVLSHHDTMPKGERPAAEEPTAPPSN